jgi:acyl-CoA thioester hydrolase
MSAAPLRGDYAWFQPITTRWMDNDLYGHVNNVTYYSYFDSAVNRYLIEEGGLDIHTASVVGFVVHSSCTYLSPIAYPSPLDVGLRVDRLGNSSATYGLAIFLRGESAASAHGSLTHVFVDRNQNHSVPIPTATRIALERLCLPESAPGGNL